MSQENAFSYNYSAKENKEVQEIRKKYLPQGENKLEELKRLDKQVQESGIVKSLVIGIIGFLLFGTGVCLTVGVIGNGIWMAVLGVLLGIVGAAGMIVAYPLYRKVFNKRKAELTPRILELVAECDAAQGNK